MFKGRGEGRLFWANDLISVQINMQWNGMHVRGQVNQQKSDKIGKKKRFVQVSFPWLVTLINICLAFNQSHTCQHNAQCVNEYHRVKAEGTRQAYKAENVISHRYHPLMEKKTPPHSYVIYMAQNAFILTLWIMYTFSCSYTVATSSSILNPSLRDDFSYFCFYQKP